MFAKYRFTIISIIIVIAAAIPLFLLSVKNKKAMTPQEQMTNQTMQQTASPSPLPTLTQQNADSQLNQTDQQVQNSMNQTDTDLQSINQIDTTQDSTTGL
ncbi:MAG: hypothetical protein ACREGI_02695 [Candidatus Levyibacteriota bacterium]